MVPAHRGELQMIKLPNSKNALRAAISELVADFLERGGRITVCKPGKARG